MGIFNVLGRVPRWVLLGVLLIAAVAVASTLARVSQATSATAYAEELRDGLLGMRAELDACLTTRAQMELRFEELGRQVDRLRQSVDSLEALDERGVPSESYDTYLGLVEDYNAAIPEWELETEELRAQVDRCRSLAEVHNVRADSLRRFLVDEGIWEEGWLESGDDG